MNWRLAAAAVIGLIVIGGGLAFLGGRQGGVGGQPSTTAATTRPGASPGSTPASSTSNLAPGELCSASATCRTGVLDPGTYSIAAGAYTQAALSFTVPAGWATDSDAFVTKHVDAPGEVLFSAPWVVTHIFTDVCDDNPAPIDAGTTIGELASALAAQDGGVSSAVTDATVGGYAAKRIELSLPAGACRGGNARYWPGPGADLNTGYCCMPIPSTEVISIVDVAGERLVVIARHRPDSSAEDLAELQAIVDSIQIEPPVAGTSPAGASRSP